MSKLKSLDKLFDGRHFDREIILLCVRWYLRYKLSLRDLVEMMADRGLSLAHTTILRWVQRYSPEFVKRWNRFSSPTHRTVVRCRRNVPEDPRKVGLSLSGGGSGRPDGRLHAARQTRRGSSKGIFQEGHQASGAATENHHARWLDLRST
jgi:hypothetical protein